MDRTTGFSLPSCISGTYHTSRSGCWSSVGMVEFFFGCYHLNYNQKAWSITIDAKTDSCRCVPRHGGGVLGHCLPECAAIILFRLPCRGCCERRRRAVALVQLRRARCWVPCVDTFGCGCPWRLRLTVAEGEAAAAAGRLTRTAWAAGGARKAFHYSLDRCTPPCHVAWAVGARPAAPERRSCGHRGQEPSTTRLIEPSTDRPIDLLRCCPLRSDADNPGCCVKWL